MIIMITTIIIMINCNYSNNDYDNDDMNNKNNVNNNNTVPGCSYHSDNIGCSFVPNIEFHFYLFGILFQEQRWASAACTLFCPFYCPDQ